MLVSGFCNDICKWLDFLVLSDKDASQHLKLGCILYVYCRKECGQSIFFRRLKICHSPAYCTQFFLHLSPPPPLTHTLLHHRGLRILPEAHNPERLTSMLRLCNGVFTSRFISRQAFPANCFRKANHEQLRHQ